MARFEPRLTEARRAGLLAASAVYPLSRLAGTLPRPPFDRALVSGVSMAVAFQAARLSTAALRTSQGLGDPSRVRQSVRTAVVAGAVTAGSAVLAARVRSTASTLAGNGERMPLGEAALGAGAELLTVAAGATTLVSVGDATLLTLPGPWRATHPAVRGVGVVLAGAVLGAGARHPRMVEWLSLPPTPGARVAPPAFQEGANLPMALARSAAVAGATVAGLAVDRAAAVALAKFFTGSQDPPTAAVAGGHAVLVGGVLLAGAAGFAFYSSRVAVQERLLEAAYAAVPSRPGVTGGISSAYEFADLGREGRRFVSQAYSAEELEQVLGRPCTDPVRAWLPYEALSGDPEKDARSLVEEIERLGGFSRSLLVLAAPTGDGYVSYVQTESAELLTAGDCTTAAVPYANVPSAVAMPRRARASAAFAVYARAVAARAAEVNPAMRLVTFGESLGSIIALDAFGPGLVDELGSLGFSGGLYCGVPVYSRTDRALRPRHPEVLTSGGLQYVGGREQALSADAGHVNVTHPTDPVAVADPTTLVRHATDYWGRPHGTHVPLVSFLVHLFDVKNAMNLRPGDFAPSPGHDYRYDTAAGVSRAYGLPFDDEELVEAALRERELSWSVRRLLSKRLDDARESALAKLTSWGVDPETVATRFHIDPASLPSWLTSSREEEDTEEDYLG
ncbi:MAG: hypothetical protein GC157_01480 [Frankiales bacterium]|nr:hypothetical protein [Frankiales bacterium]